jgi:thiosulfate/3-mercaptopyruvate sulfurtransferase
MASVVSSLLISPLGILGKGSQHFTKLSSRLMSGGRTDLGSKTNKSFPAVISAAEAVELFRSNKGVKFIDGSWHLGGDRNATADYLSERIPGASFFNIDEVRDTTNDLPHMLPTVKTFESTADAMGIKNDDHVIVYVHPGSFAAPRVWYTFRTFGHEKVSIINGGLAAFVGAGGPTETGEPEEAASSKTPSPSGYKASFNPSCVMSAADVLGVVSTGSAQILDARSKGRFEGTAPEPRPGLVGGHIPGSLSLPFTAIVKDGDVTTFKTPAEIRDEFKKAGIILGARVVLTCGSGVTAAVLALGLHLLGAPLEATPIYDGSWSEWGDPKRTDLPKVK